MAYEELLACLDQMEVLLTRVKDLARRIEIRSGEPDADPNEPLAERQVYIGRLEKCEKRISALLSRLPSGERGRVERVLFSGGESGGFPEEAALAGYGARCRALRREIRACDAESLKQIKRERDRLQKRINGSRGPEGRSGAPFSSRFLF